MLGSDILTSEIFGVNIKFMELFLKLVEDFLSSFMVADPSSSDCAYFSLFSSKDASLSVQEILGIKIRQVITKHALAKKQQWPQH